jgi:hypothetical protein
VPWCNRICQPPYGVDLVELSVRGLSGFSLACASTNQESAKYRPETGTTHYTAPPRYNYEGEP